MAAFAFSLAVWRVLFSRNASGSKPLPSASVLLSSIFFVAGGARREWYRGEDHRKGMRGRKPLGLIHHTEKMRYAEPGTECVYKCRHATILNESWQR